MDKFDRVEAMTPADREAHFEQNVVTNWEQLPERAHDAAKAMATKLERLAQQP